MRASLVVVAALLSGCTTPLVAPDGATNDLGGGEAGGHDAGGGPDGSGPDLDTFDADVPDTGPPCHSAAECDDGNMCNGSESCSREGLCLPGTPPDCSDGVACTADTCAASTGCAHTPNDSLCTATFGGHCDPVMDCQYVTCSPSTCMPDPSTCTTASCTGLTTCMRTSTCGAGASCCAGACAPIGCDDGNPCTDDACGASGCTHTFNTVACDDGQLCTAADHCTSGVCRGTLRHCPVTYICDPDTGVCGPAL